MALVLILVGTNIGRNKRRRVKKPGKKKQLVQFMEGTHGTGGKCELMEDTDIGTCAEDKV